MSFTSLIPRLLRSAPLISQNLSESGEFFSGGGHRSAISWSVEMFTLLGEMVALLQLVQCQLDPPVATN